MPTLCATEEQTGANPILVPGFFHQAQAQGTLGWHRGALLPQRHQPTRADVLGSLIASNLGAQSCFCKESDGKASRILQLLMKTLKTQTM